MGVFFVDMDNTIIYSSRHDIGTDKIPVELYEGRNISFISKKTLSLLSKACETHLIVPISTRTIEQYNRIKLGALTFKYELVCNGGILLLDGRRDASWYMMSLEAAHYCNGQFKNAMEFLGCDKRRTFEVRFIERLFVFTKCSASFEVKKDLSSILDMSLVDVYTNGSKIYVLPKALSKGECVKRFIKRFRSDIPHTVIAAGDSEFDISMLSIADVAIAPFNFKSEYNIDFDVKECPEGTLFSEFALSTP